MKEASGDEIILHMCTKNHNHDVCFLRCGIQQTYFFLILGHFLPFDPPNNLKNQSFEKMEKMPEDIIIFTLAQHK